MNLKMKRKLVALDKRNAAFHEAGHLTVGQAQRGYGQAWIYPTNTADPMNERAWSGTYQRPGGITPAIAVAGLVAEYWATDPEVDPDDILWELDGPSVSDTDRSGIPEDEAKRFDAVVEAIDLLEEHREFFDWAVRMLLKYETILEREAMEVFDELYGE